MKTLFNVSATLLLFACSPESKVSSQQAQQLESDADKIDANKKQVEALKLAFLEKFVSKDISIKMSLPGSDIVHKACFVANAIPGKCTVYANKAGEPTQVETIASGNCSLALTTVFTTSLQPECTKADGESCSLAFSGPVDLKAVLSDSDLKKTTFEEKSEIMHTVIEIKESNYCAQMFTADVAAGK